LENPLNSPTVFISYSHDSDEHSARVLALADRLIGDGIACRLDRYEPSPPEGWPVWMDRQVDEADFVLVVCTERYSQKAKASKPVSGLGVKFESILILNDLYQAGMWNERFIPVLFEDLPVEKILRPLQGYTRFRVDQEEGYEDLLRLLTGQPAYPRPALGPGRTLPPKPRGSGTAQATPVRTGGSSQSRALELWKERLVFLQEQEALVVEATQKFALKKQIEEAREKVREYGG
jgi:hypothetical protein